MDEDDAEFFPQLTCSFHVAGPVGCSDAGGFCATGRGAATDPSANVVTSALDRMLTLLLASG